MKKKIVLILLIVLVVLSAQVFAQGQQIYTVVPGDTMWLISMRYNMKLLSLVRANPHIEDPNWIYPGDQLIIPDVGTQMPQQPYPFAQEIPQQVPQQQVPQQEMAPTPEMGSIRAMEQQVVQLVNEERLKRGLDLLEENLELSRVARIKAQDMVDRGYFAHESPTYGSPFEMMKSFKIQYMAAGENIAKGARSPEEVMAGWMNSKGHRENILNANFTEIGVGLAQDSRGIMYWSQMFIRPASY